MSRGPVAGRTDDLTDTDREILDHLEAVYRDGPVLGADLARIVGVEGKAIGGRLSGLVRRGFVMGRITKDGETAWTLTLTAVCGTPWRHKDDGASNQILRSPDGDPT